LHARAASEPRRADEEPKDRFALTLGAYALTRHPHAALTTGGRSNRTRKIAHMREKSS
jgi:hypothetical protein